MKKWLIGLFSFLGGIIFAIAAEVGAVVVTAGSVRVETVLKWSGLNAEDYLTEEYYSQTFLQIFLGFKNGETTFDSLGSISKITPLLDDAMTYLNEQLDSFGFQLNVEELYAVNFNDLGDYLSNYAMENICIANIAHVDETSDHLLQYICFNKKDDGTYDYENPRNINYFLQDGNVDALVANLTLGDAMDVGTEGLLYLLKDVPLANIQDEVMELKISDIVEISETDHPALQYLGQYKINEVSDALNNATLGDLLPITPGENTAMDYLANVNVNQLGEAINNATLGDLIPIDSSSHPALQYLANYGVNDISDAMTNATLGDLLEIDSSSHPALQYLASYKVDQFTTALNDATLGDLLGVPTDTESMLYKLKDVKISELETEIQEQTLGTFMDIDTDSPLYALKDTAIKDIPTAINDLTIEQLMPGADFTSGILKAIKDYKVSELAGAMDTLTIGELLDIDVTDPSTTPLMKFLAPYTIPELDGVENDIKIKHIVEIDSSSPVLLQNIAELGINDLEDYLTTVTLGQVIDVGTDPLLVALKDVQINGPAMSAAIQDLELGTVIEIDSTSPMILQSLQHTQIKNISTAINSLTIGEIFDTTGNKLLTALAGSTLDTVGDDIYNVPIGSMIEIDSTSPAILQAIQNYTLGNIGTNINNLLLSDVVDTSSNIFLAALPADTTIGNVGEKMNQIKLEAVFADEMYEAGQPHDDAHLKASWKYLLKDDHGTINHDYTICDMGVLIENMERNMQEATIGDLSADGWIDVDAATLAKYVPSLGKTIGECTMSEFIEAVAAYIP